MRNIASSRFCGVLRLVIWLFVCHSLAAWSQQTNVAPAVAEARIAPTTRTGLVAETQWRPGLDPTRYPLLEIYLSNHGEKPVECKDVFLNGVKAQPMTEVVWFQFYPLATIGRGQVAVLQISLVEPPKAALSVGIELKNGERLEMAAPPFAAPAVRLAGMTFASSMNRVFIAWTCAGNQGVPVELQINGADCSGGMRVMELPAGKQPGMIAAELPAPLAPGQPVHARLGFKDGAVAQTLLRAWKGIFLDDFGVKETDAKLRQELGLDARPSARMIGDDPACADLQAGKKYGKSMPHILATRKAWFETGDDRLAYEYLCTAATAGKSYSVYAQATDGIQVNPYHLAWSQNARFIESEEQYYRWARMAAAPRPWYWIPEAFTIIGRYLEPQELRLQTYAALGNGLKGIRYFIYGGMPPNLHGYEKNAPLLAEIKKLNAEIKKLEPILAHAIPMATDTVGTETEGCRVYTLWSGDDGVLAIVRNLRYTSTDRTPNDFGRKTGFKAVEKINLTVAVRKPSWLTLRPAGGNAAEPAAMDALTQEPVAVKAENCWLELLLPRLSLAQAIWIPNEKRKDGA